jgi:hypothetical protein
MALIVDVKSPELRFAQRQVNDELEKSAKRRGKASPV